MLRRTSVPDNLSVEVVGTVVKLRWDDGEAVVSLRSSARARTVRAVLDECEVIIRHPQRITRRRLEASVKALAGWIIAAEQIARQRVQSLEENMVFYAGERLPIRFDPHHPRVGRDESGFLAPSQAKLQTWMKQDARRTLAPLVEEWAARMDVTVSSVRISSPRRRWGSCSSRGTISLNWRLVMAPPAVQEYLVIHELAHRREMNHSARYWKIVAEHCPAYLEHERWLKENGWRLMAFGTDV